MICAIVLKKEKLREMFKFLIPWYVFSKEKRFVVSSVHLIFYSLFSLEVRIIFLFQKENIKAKRKTLET